MVDLYLNVPHTCYPYLSQQRTDYSGYDLGAQYEQDMQRLYYNIEESLPLKLNSMLDIGAGLGGIDALIYKNNPMATFYLLDKDGEYGSKVGWHDDAKAFGAYNSFSETRNFLRANNVPDESAHLITEIPDQTFDLVTSFLSWGFHYPVSTYLEEVRSKTKSLIIDVRKETNGFVQLAKVFDTITILADCKKHLRLWCRV